MKQQIPKPTDLPTNIQFELVLRELLPLSCAPSFPDRVPKTAPTQSMNNNVLLLFHGIGDRSAPFGRLARALKLRQTVCLSIQGPFPMPFELNGFHWGDDVVMDPSSSDDNSPELECDPGFKNALPLIARGVIMDGLIGKCGYELRDIILYGFGQGGCLALAVAAELEELSDKELAGVISIGGRLPREIPALVIGKKWKTPVLLCYGERTKWVSRGDVERLKDKFSDVRIEEWPRKGDAMPNTREEMYPIMEFFARRLISPRIEGSVEIKGVEAVSMEDKG